MDRMEQLKAVLSLCLIFGVAFCLGSVVGHTVSVRDQAVMARPAQKDWGLSFQEDNKPPVADESMEQLAQYDAFYAENTTEKVLYLTFDCGYENGNTPAILDALKKHHVPAAFFIVGNYLEKNPGGGTYHREPQLPSSGYEPDGKRRVSKGAGAAGRPVRADYRRKNGEVLPPAPGQIQRQQSAACKGAWVSDDFLEPCLCGLEAGGTADSRRGDVKAVKKSSSGSDCTAAQYVPDER